MSAFKVWVGLSAKECRGPDRPVKGLLLTVGLFLRGRLCRTSPSVLIGVEKIQALMDGFRVIHRKSLTLQENWHKAHQISRTFGLIWNFQFSIIWDSEKVFCSFFPHRETIKKSVSEIENSPDTLKIRSTKLRLLYNFECKDEGTRFVDVWRDQEKS